MKRAIGQVNIGVVGFGARSRSVLKRLLPQDSRLHLKGVYDIDPEAAGRAKDQLELKEVQAYESLEALVGESGNRLGVCRHI